MNLFVVIATTVGTIILYKLLIRLYLFIKFCVAVNKLPGPVAYPLPTLNFQLRKIKSEGILIFKKYIFIFMRIYTSTN